MTSNQDSIRDVERPPYRELELLFQASRTSPMLHEAAVTVEQYLRALEEAQQFPVETVMRDEFMASFVGLRNALIWAGTTSSPASEPKP